MITIIGTNVFLIINKHVNCLKKKKRTYQWHAIPFIQQLRIKKGQNLMQLLRKKLFFKDNEPRFSNAMRSSGQITLYGISSPANIYIYTSDIIDNMVYKNFQ